MGPSRRSCPYRRKWKPPPLDNKEDQTRLAKACEEGLKANEVRGEEEEDRRGVVETGIRIKKQDLSTKMGKVGEQALVGTS